ncbi:hypothetical protein JXC34_06620 [Candidatus Woesearchaeota archaeon]|nr:hypothetical protein [Candidatus Woesearchaeota archaeon]
MFRRFSHALAWWRWLFSFSALKYLGLLIMTAGPLSFIYLYIFRGSAVYVAAIGSLLAFVLGFIIWINGWDPYETIIPQNQAYEFLMLVKETFEFVEWWKWLMEFSFFKYIGLAFMILGPLVFMYRRLFLDTHMYELLIGGGLTFATGVVIWMLSWDPYK